MKKGFTLIELLVVIVIIGIVLGAFTFLMLGYQAKVAFKNDVLKLNDSFFVWDKVYSTPQRSPIVNGIFVIKEGESFDIGYELDNGVNLDSQFLKIARFEDIYFSGDKLSQLKLVKYPYKVGCPVKDNVGNLRVGKVTFKLKGSSKDYCGEIDLAICKLTILKCPD